MDYYTFKAKKNYNSVYLFLKEKQFSEHFITNLRKKMGYIKINNNPATTNSVLNRGDILSIKSNPNQKTTIMHCILPLNIVFEDEYYLLINKPSNLSSSPTRSHYDHNLAGAVCNYMDKKDQNFTLRMINRLDKDTSGLVLIAKDLIAQKEIGFIYKKYLAVCEGKVDKKITIDSPILTITNQGFNEIRRVINPKGKPAITQVDPIKFNDRASLVELSLIHGRTHQIRLHMSSINHSLIGDSLYGKSSEIIDHTALICYSMSFFHPFLDKELNFQINPEEDFDKLLVFYNLK